MKYEKLNQEMVRYFDNMKPRHTNPTFLSSNVGTSLGNTMNRSKSTNIMGMSRNMSEIKLPSIERYQTNNDENTNREYFSISRSKSSFSLNKGQSNLHNYGMSSLEPMKKSITGKDVYEKQAKKYNIVTIQPKEYIDTINLYPKFRLQNSDESFYKKLVATNHLLSPTNSKQGRSCIDLKLNLNPQKI